MNSAPSLPISPAFASRDAAWVTIPTPLTHDVLKNLCNNIEALFRVNPYYTFSSFRNTGPNCYSAELANHSNQKQLLLEFSVEDAGDTLTISYKSGIKRRTVLTIAAEGSGSRLTITDDYDSLPEKERTERISEVDKSLNAWGEALRVYFVRFSRWSWLPGWRWYIRRVWIPMTPSARRVVWLLYLFTVAEFFFFLFVLAIWQIEHS